MGQTDTSYMEVATGKKFRSMVNVAKYLGLVPAGEMVEKVVEKVKVVEKLKVVEKVKEVEIAEEELVSSSSSSSSLVFSLLLCSLFYFGLTLFKSRINHS